MIFFSYLSCREKKERKERKGRNEKNRERKEEKRKEGKEKRKEGKRGSKLEEILIVHHLNIAVLEYPEAMEKISLWVNLPLIWTPVPIGSACPGGSLSAGHSGRTLLTAWTLLEACTRLASPLLPVRIQVGNFDVNINSSLRLLWDLCN